MCFAWVFRAVRGHLKTVQLHAAGALLCFCSSEPETSPATAILYCMYRALAWCWSGLFPSEGEPMAIICRQSNITLYNCPHSDDDCTLAKQSDCTPAAACCRNSSSLVRRTRRPSASRITCAQWWPQCVTAARSPTAAPLLMSQGTLLATQAAGVVGWTPQQPQLWLKQMLRPLGMQLVSGTGWA